MIDMLASTGMRVGEMVLLNQNDIDFNERECIVFGKGSKERVVYFDARTKIHLQNYLDSKNDDNLALFVSLYFMVSSGGCGHRGIGYLVRLIRIIEVMSFSIGLKLFNNAVSTFGIVFSHICFNS